MTMTTEVFLTIFGGAITGGFLAISFIAGIALWRENRRMR